MPGLSPTASEIDLFGDSLSKSPINPRSDLKTPTDNFDSLLASLGSDKNNNHRKSTVDSPDDNRSPVHSTTHNDDDDYVAEDYDEDFSDFEEEEQVTPRPLSARQPSAKQPSARQPSARLPSPRQQSAKRQQLAPRVAERQPSASTLFLPAAAPPAHSDDSSYPRSLTSGLESHHNQPVVAPLTSLNSTVNGEQSTGHTRSVISQSPARISRNPSNLSGSD